MNAKRKLRNIGLGLVLLLAGAFATGCTGVITQTRSGKLDVQVCAPSLKLEGQNQVFAHCQVPQKQKAKKKAKKKRLQSAGLQGMDLAVRSLMR